MKSKNSAVSGDSSRYIFCPAAMISSGVPVGAGLPSLKYTIYDKLVKNRTAQARTMGYENYLELGYYRMNRNCYGKDEVEAFRRQIKEYFVPFAEKLHDRRRQRLGLEKLSYIDEQVYFKDGNPAPTGTPEEIMAAGQKMYR